MAEHRPVLRHGKPTLIGPLAVGAVILALILAAVFVRRPDEAVTPPPPPPVVAPVIPVRPPLSKADLITAVDASASAYAAGAKSPTTDLPGRKFSVEIPFGCEGPHIGPGGGTLQMELDPLRRTLRLAAQPMDWSEFPQIKSLPDSPAVETVRGFWLPRPWTGSQDCGVQPQVPPQTPTPPSADTLGLAQVFTAATSRVDQRRGRPYEAVRKAPEDAPGSVIHPYAFVLEGTVETFSDGQSVHCWSEAPDHRPICLVAVKFDRIAFRDPTSDKPLAEWLE